MGKIKKFFKILGKNLAVFLIGAIIGFIINAALVFPYAVRKIGEQQDIGLGIIAVAPVLFIIYGIISVVIGGFLAVVGFNVISIIRRKKP